MITERNLQAIKQRYGIIGNCAALNRALDIAVQVAPTDLAVLVEGENGVGKESIPRLIHDNSVRKHKKYFAINCGSIPEGTIDSELFGHEKGSFTGAINDHEGYFEAANGGTLFLDEVGELPLSTQVKLLRVLEAGEYIRVGSNEVRKTDVRVIAATNVKMKKAMQEGRFREDLYYRLANITINMPALRDRGNDVELLFRKFAADCAEKYHLDPIYLTDDGKQLLHAYKWPGNIRQLKNLTEQLSILSPSRAISAQSLLEAGITKDDEATGALVVRQAGHSHSYENERDMILQQLLKLNEELQRLKAQVAQGDNQLHLPAESSSALEHGQYITAEPLLEEEREEPITLKSLTDQNILSALKRNNNNRKKAAEELGISERTIYRKIKELGLDK